MAERDWASQFLNCELDVGCLPRRSLAETGWTFDVARLCRGTKSPLPSPSNRFSSSECGADDASNQSFTKTFRRRSVSVNPGKLSIVPKRRASWPAGRCAEKLCTNCGRNTERKSLGTFPRLHVFRCSSKFLMRRRSCRYRCIRLKMLRADWEASRRASFGTWPSRIRTPSFS